MSGPISVTTRPISEADRAALSEQTAIRLGVADLTFAWASVENAMVMLLADLIGHPSGHLASAIFFAPTGIEARTKLVDSALKCRTKLACARMPSGTEIEALLIKEWDSIMAQLNRLRKTRNKVAHGEMTIFSGTADSPGYARLTAPILKMDDGREEALLKGQKPGLGSNELATSVAAVISAVEEVRSFGALVHLMDDGDSASLLQKLSEGEGETRRPLPPDNQTPQEPESPRPPSPE
jgi:hypothetical protein